MDLEEVPSLVGANFTTDIEVCKKCCVCNQINSNWDMMLLTCEHFAHTRCYRRHLFNVKNQFKLPHCPICGSIKNDKKMVIEEKIVKYISDDRTAITKYFEGVDNKVATIEDIILRSNNKMLSITDRQVGSYIVKDDFEKKGSELNLVLTLSNLITLTIYQDCHGCYKVIYNNNKSCIEQELCDTFKNKKVPLELTDIAIFGYCDMQYNGKSRKCISHTIYTNNINLSESVLDVTDSSNPWSVNTDEIKIRLNFINLENDDNSTQLIIEQRGGDTYMQWLNKKYKFTSKKRGKLNQDLW